MKGLWWLYSKYYKWDSSEGFVTLLLKLNYSNEMIEIGNRNNVKYKRDSNPFRKKLSISQNCNIFCQNFQTNPTYLSKKSIPFYMPVQCDLKIPSTTAQ